MSLEGFWTNVRMAASAMVPKAAVDSPRLDKESIEKILRSSTFWLMPWSVKGYDSEDFKFLPKDEQSRLDEGVREFEAVAATVHENPPPTTAQIDEGVKGLTKILLVVRPDKYADFLAFVIGKKIEGLAQGEMREWVREMVFETGPDASGTPALWIWVVVEDSATQEDSFHDEFSLISESLRRAAAQVAPERWPYIRLRTISEQYPAIPQRPKTRSNKK